MSRTKELFLSEHVSNCVIFGLMSRYCVVLTIGVHKYQIVPGIWVLAHRIILLIKTSEYF